MISSAQRALRIMESVGRATRPVGVTEIAREHSLASGTVFRSLNALEQSRYVAKYQFSSRYVIGPVVQQLRQRLLARFRLRDVSLPYLHQLAFASGETVSLTVPIGWYGLRIAAARGTNEVTSSLPIGSIRNLKQTCPGRAILAFSTDETHARYAEWDKAHDINSDERMSRKDISETRGRGFAIEVPKFAPGRAAVAFPLHGHLNPIAAVAIEGPALQLDPVLCPETVEQWLAIVHPLQMIVTARLAEFANPLEHLDPSSISLSGGRADAALAEGPPAPTNGKRPQRR